MTAREIPLGLWSEPADDGLHPSDHAYEPGGRRRWLGRAPLVWFAGAQEYRVRCPGCCAAQVPVLTAPGDVDSPEAGEQAIARLRAQGWVERGGRWYCTHDHAPEVR